MDIPKEISDPQIVFEYLGDIDEHSAPIALADLMNRYGTDAMVAIHREYNREDPDDASIVISRPRLENADECNLRVAQWVKEMNRHRQIKQDIEAKERRELVRLQDKYGNGND